MDIASARMIIISALVPRLRDKHVIGRPLNMIPYISHKPFCLQDILLIKEFALFSSTISLAVSLGRDCYSD